MSWNLPLDLKPRWSDKYQVRAYDVSPQGTLKLPVLFSYMQQTAWRHAEHLGFGYSAVKDSGLAWVLFQVEVHISRLPIWDEEFLLDTWPSGINKFLYSRDFRMYSPEGETLAIATSTWILIDLGTRRPRHFQLIEEMAHHMPKERTFDRLPERIRVPQEGKEEKIFARYGDLDQNGHVNTSRYVEWAVNTLPFAWHTARGKLGVVVNFLQETRLAESLIIRSAESQGRQIVWGSRADGQVAYTMALWPME